MGNIRIFVPFLLEIDYLRSNMWNRHICIRPKYSFLEQSLERRGSKKPNFRAGIRGDVKPKKTGPGDRIGSSRS
jgi:hypothetical protein